MNKKILILVSYFVISGCVLLSCYSKTYDEPGKVDFNDMQNEISFRADYDTTWQAVLRVMRRYPLEYERKSDGRISTKWLSGPSDKLYSGFGENRIPYTARYQVTVKIIKEQPDITTVKTFSKEQFLSDVISERDLMSGSLHKWYDTEPSTRREYKVLRLIERELEKFAKK